MPDSPMEIRAKAKIHDRTHGAYASQPPVVIWRRRGCNERLLRVYLSPSGWTVIRDDFSVKRAEGLERRGIVLDGSPATVDDISEGRIAPVNVRAVRGDGHTLPLEVTTWPDDQVELGCRHGHAYVALALIADACKRFRSTHVRVDESVDVGW